MVAELNFDYKMYTVSSCGSNEILFSGFDANKDDDVTDGMVEFIGSLGIEDDWSYLTRTNKIAECVGTIKSILEHMYKVNAFVGWTVVPTENDFHHVISIQKLD